MAVLNKIDWDKLKAEYIDLGYINTTKHPTYDIWILNYTPTVQYNNMWDDYTSACRGLVIDIEGNILARPLSKFKNMVELDENDIPHNISFDVFDKLDGSLIILFYYNNEWVVASRGSFISDMALKAKEIFKKYDLNDLQSNITYLFEIIYKENVIVVDYGDTEDCFMLTAINTETGHEIKYDDMVTLFPKFKFVEKMRHCTPFENKEDMIYFFKSIQQNEVENKEGYVVKFSNNFRFKLKFNEYVRLHRFATRFTDYDIWDILANNKNLEDTVEVIPDEIYPWFKKTVEEFMFKYNDIERKSLLIFYNLYCCNGLGNKKEFAEYALKYKEAPILFKLFDRRAYDYIIWGIIKPKVKSNPFMNRMKKMGPTKD